MNQMTISSTHPRATRLWRRTSVLAVVAAIALAVIVLIGASNPIRLQNPGTRRPITSLAFNNSATLLATGGYTGTLSL